MNRLLTGLGVSAVLLLAVVWIARPLGCAIEELCYEHRDCPSPLVCDTLSGDCVPECTDDEDCGGFPFTCVDQVCTFTCEDEGLTCPDGMVPICGAYCMDVYEASRPDATEDFGGSDDSMAVSQPGVIPWYSGTLKPQEGSTACQAAGKRLCTPQEWEVVCSAFDGREYCYGDEYDPVVCNSVDTFCDPDCGVYPDCFRDCDYDNRVMPTGSFPDCTNDLGVYDLSGNVWEAVYTDDSAEHYRGGAFDCGDPSIAHSCGYDGISMPGFPATRGFRCCADGEPAP